ncbi:MAG: pyrroline-5-carboxylate reductase [Deferrisomatales bacterium]|nr:pyrroline-5-carboxylate reductase [Deferrisomatales bacterium]
MTKLPLLAVVGLGNMGEALVRGLLERGLTEPSRVVGAEKAAPRREEMAARYGITAHPTPAAACRGAGAVVLAVKPQDVGGALADLALVLENALLVSVCAGVTLASLARPLPPGTPIVRAMPNTPALVGCGVSVYCANEHVGAADDASARALLGALGEVHRVESEPLLDGVTGLSGSGPAYVFAFLEALADGGVLVGLPRDLARALAVQTVLGAAQLAKASGEHTAVLKDRVASPGGTTIEGLRELERSGFRGAVLEAVRAATIRSRELGS